MNSRFTVCPLCEAMCGLRLDEETGGGLAVRGDEDDGFSRGHICPKGAAIGALHEDPDRLRRPLKRTETGFVEVGWDEALALAGDRLGAIRAAHGPRAVAVYLGNPVVHNIGATLGGLLLLRALRTQARYSASTVDQMPKQVSSWLLYGHQLLFPIPDVDRTDLLVIVGANPLASNGSLMAAPGIRRRLREIRARGGRVVLLDPRRTETAKVADAHHFVRPGTDAFVLAAMARVLLGERGDPVDDRLPTRGADTLRALLAPFTPERAAAQSGLAATEIVALARALADTPRASVYGRIGTTAQAWGTLCSWLVDVINLLSHHLDREGGVLFAEPVVDLTASDRLLGPGSRGRWASLVRGAPEVNGELPVATLAEDIEAPGAERVRALLTIAGNPALSAPGADALRHALGRLEFMVSVDPYLNETTRHADLILPPAGVLARAHFDLALAHTMVRNVARYAPAPMPVPEGERSDFAILGALARGVARGRVPWRRRLLIESATRLGEARLLDVLIRTGPYGARSPHRLSLGKLAAHPHGLDLGPLKPGLSRRMRVDAIDLAPPLIADELRRLAAALDAPITGLGLSGRRDLRSNNSWMHNEPALVAGRDRCTLQVHPDDAARHGLVQDGQARVDSAVGSLVAPVEVTDAVMPGVVSLPHGWGHEPASGQRVARARPGVNVNVLTDPGPLDVPSGNAVLNGVPVRVAPA